MGFLDDDDDDDRRKKAGGFFILVLVVLSCTLIGTSVQRLRSNGTPNRTTPLRPRSLTTPPWTSFIFDAEYGLAYDWHTKSLADEAMLGGLHLGPPGFKFIKFPSTYLGFDIVNSTCVSKDGLRVQFSVTFQFQLPMEWVKPVVEKYKDLGSWYPVVVAAGRSSVQHTCSLFEISNFQNSRGIIQGSMETKLREKLEGPNLDGIGGVYARAISLQLSNIELPQDYRDSVTEKQQASEDITLAINQRTQRPPKPPRSCSAREEAKKINNTAVNEAAVILTEANLHKTEIEYGLQQETLAYAAILDNTDSRNEQLSKEGLLAFIGNRLFEEHPGVVRASLEEPARASWKAEL